MKTKIRLYRNKKTDWCNAVHPRKLFLGWNDNTIHLNIPVFFASIIINIIKP